MTTATKEYLTHLDRLCEERKAAIRAAADTVTGFNGKDTVTLRALNEFVPEALIRARAMAGGK